MEPLHNDILYIQMIIVGVEGETIVFTVACDVIRIITKNYNVITT